MFSWYRAASPENGHQFEELLKSYETASEMLTGTEIIQRQLDHSSNQELAKQVLSPIRS